MIIVLMILGMGVAVPAMVAILVAGGPLWMAILAYPVFGVIGMIAPSLIISISEHLRQARARADERAVYPNW